jgi:WhiB family redox-sensing transcriptional regulator
MTARPFVLELVFRGNLGNLVREIPSMDWSSEAECATADPEMFFPSDFQQELQALSLCHTCPVKKECLVWALFYEEKGIWGGTTERMRAARATKAQTYRDLSESDAALQLRDILYSPAEVVAAMFHVNPRTVVRWRNGIKKSPQAMGIARGFH